MNVKVSRLTPVIALSIVIAGNLFCGARNEPAPVKVQMAGPPGTISAAPAAYSSTTVPENTRAPVAPFPFLPEDKPAAPASTSDTYFSLQWGLKAVSVPAAWWQAAPGERIVTVAVLDTGIDTGHEDLQGKIAASMNFTGTPSTNDLYGHGTAMAGVIAASSDNSTGIAGLAPNCRLLNVKVASDSGMVKAADVARGIIWAADNGANIINISLEIREPSAELEAAVAYAWDRGAVIIAAAGNDGRGYDVFPACYDKCLAVTGLTENLELAPLANRAAWV